MGDARLLLFLRTYEVETTGMPKCSPTNTIKWAPLLRQGVSRQFGPLCGVYMFLYQLFSTKTHLLLAQLLFSPGSPPTPPCPRLIL